MRLTSALLALLALSTQASAQSLLDQQPTQKFSLWAQAQTESVADDFVVTTPVKLDIVTIWGAFEPAGAYTGDSFTVILHDNATQPPFGDNVPGTTLATYTGVFPSVVQTGQTVPTSTGGQPEHLLALGLPSSLTLPPGHYWVEIYNEGTSGSGETFTWEMAALDPVAGSPCVAWSTSTPGAGSWNPCTPFPEKEMAMQLIGTVLSGPELDVTGLVSGGSATITISDATLNGVVLAAFSVAGGGGVPTPFGDLLLTPPYSTLPLFLADGTGLGAQTLPVPPGLTGLPVWIQGMDLSGLELTWNGVAATIG